jgi:hypothetical protein
MRETITLDMKTQLQQVFELLHRLSPEDKFFYTLSRDMDGEGCCLTCGREDAVHKPELITLTLETIEKKERSGTTAFSLLAETIPILHSFGGDVVGEAADDLAIEHSRARILLRKIRSFILD